MIAGSQRSFDVAFLRWSFCLAFNPLFTDCTVLIWLQVILNRIRCTIIVEKYFNLEILRRSYPNIGSYFADCTYLWLYFVRKSHIKMSNSFCFRKFWFYFTKYMQCDESNLFIPPYFPVNHRCFDFTYLLRVRYRVRMSFGLRLRNNMS